MTRALHFTFKPYNPDQLRAEMVAVVDTVTGMGNWGGEIVVSIEAASDAEAETHRPALQAVIDAHDPAVLTEKQQIKTTAETIRASLVTIIGDRIDWHEANPAAPGTVEARLQTEMVYLMKWIRKDLI